MDAFTSLTIYPDYKTGHFIQWELNPVIIWQGPISFTLQVSEVEDFSEILWSKEVGDEYYTIDDSNLKKSLSLNYMYRVKLTTGDNLTYYSRTLWIHNKPDTKRKFFMAAEIQRIERDVTQRFAGRRAFFLKRRAFGVIDSSSVDPVTGSVIADNVSNQNSKFKGGYYSPILTSIRILDGEEQRDSSPSGRGSTESFMYSAKIIGFPAVSNDDLFVTVDENRRYLVKTTKNFYIPGSNYCVAQRFTMALAPVTDVLYDIEVPILRPTNGN